MSTVGAYLEYRGDTQYHGGYHEYRGGIMSTVGGVQHRGGTQMTKDFFPTVLMISPTCIMKSPHGTEYPPSY